MCARSIRNFTRQSTQRKGVENAHQLPVPHRPGVRADSARQRGHYGAGDRHRRRDGTAPADLLGQLAVAAAVFVPIAYVALLGVFAVFSGDVTVPIGGEKYFCDVDCHTAYFSVLGAETVADLGSAHARGQFRRLRAHALRSGNHRAASRRCSALSQSQVVEVVDFGPPLAARAAAAAGLGRGSRSTDTARAAVCARRVVRNPTPLTCPKEHSPRLLITEGTGGAAAPARDGPVGHAKTYMALQ